METADYFWTKEALDQGKSFFDKKILQCNDKSYIKNSSNKILELDNVTFQVISNETTDSDKKNGIQWKGEVHFNATTYREYVKPDRWGMYVDFRNESGGINLPNLQDIMGTHVKLMKYNNKWYFNEDPLSENQNHDFRIMKDYEFQEIDLQCDSSYNSMLDQLTNLEKQKMLRQKLDEELANESAIPTQSLGNIVLQYPQRYGKIITEINITDCGFKYFHSEKDNIGGGWSSPFLHCWYGSIESIQYKYDDQEKAYCTDIRKRELNLSTSQMDSQFFNCTRFDFCSENEAEVKTFVNKINGALSSWKNRHSQVYERKLHPKNPRF